METMKRNWVSPVSGVQRFAPQEFVASCAGYEDATKQNAVMCLA
ncbi:MAG: hypothetical protein Q4D30_00775 [Bacteroidales bacterium]|nr:hypothetical protein [Bacteroidales bacterium]